MPLSQGYVGEQRSSSEYRESDLSRDISGEHLSYYLSCGATAWLRDMSVLINDAVNRFILVKLCRNYQNVLFIIA